MGPVKPSREIIASIRGRYFDGCGAIWISYALSATLQIMQEHAPTASASRLTVVMAALHPAQANRHPAMFILEVAAALASVLALRDAIAGGQEVLLETYSAVGLWATLVAVSCRVTMRQS